MNDDTEVQEIHPFSLSFNGTSDFQDFRPKAVTVDPKEGVDAPFAEQEEVSKEMAPEAPEGSQETLPTEAESKVESTELPDPMDELPPLPPELTGKPVIPQPKPKSITTPSAR